MKLSLLELEQKSNLLLELLSKRPVPKWAWILWAELTKITSENTRVFYSYYEQWLQALPEELSDEDIAGINPNSWLDLHDEWVVKASSKWIDVPIIIQHYLIEAKEKSIAWVQSSKKIPETDGVWIPVVEQINGFNIHDQQNGRLRCLQLIMNKSEQVNKDRLVMERAEGNSPEDDLTFQKVISVAKGWMLSQLSKKITIDGLIRYRDRSGIQTGTSLALGAAVWVCQWAQENEDLREKYQLKSEQVALTGAIEEDGTVLPVDEDGLISKVNGCFYSWISYLVVPYSQVEIAEQEVLRLNQQWPSKQLKIVGVKHIDDVFINRRLVDYKKDTMLVFWIKMAWRYKNTWIGWASLAVLVMVLMRFVYGPLDKNPIYVEGQGEYFVVRYQHGQSWRSFKSTACWVQDYERTLFDNFVFFDVDQDGNNEIFFVENDYTQVTENKLNVYEIGKEEAIWEYAPKHDVLYPKVMGSETGEMEISKVKVRRLLDGTIELFLTVYRQGTFNALLQKIEYHTKTRKEQYVHAGRINSMHWYDMDKDGKQELILTAVNNSLHAGAFIILNADSIDGNGCYYGDYVSTYPGKAKEKAYLQIKSSILAEPYYIIKYPYPYIFETSQFSDNKIQIHVYDLRG